VDDHARSLARHHRVAVALAAVVIGVGDRGVQHVRRRGHRAEDLAAGDDPTSLGPRGRCRRPGQILAGLADGGREDDAVTSDLFQRRSEPGGAPLLAGCRHHLPEADDVQHEDEVHVDAERQRCVAARESAGSDEHVVERGHPEAAELDRNRRGEISAPLDLLEALVREAGLAIVFGGAPADLLCERLGKRDETLPGLGSRRQLETHLRLLSDAATNEP
jgi:hypothetical protein